MPQIPVHIITAKPTVVGPPGVSADLMTREYAQMARFGGEVTQIGRFAFDLYQRDQVNRMYEAQADAYEGFAEMDTRYQEDDDYQTMSARWDKDADDLQKRIPKDTKLSKRSAQRFDSWFRRTRIDFGRNINLYADKKIKAQGRQLFFRNIEDKIAQAGKLDPEVLDYEIEDAIGTAIAQGYITEAEAEKVRDYIESNNLWQQIQALPEKNRLADGLEMIAKSPLDKRQRDDIKSRLADLEKSRQIGLAQQQEEDRDVLADKFANDQIPTYAEVDKTSLDEKEQAQWAKRIEQATEAITTGKENPLNQSDPKVQLDVSTRIQLEPESITAKEIYGLVGKGAKGGISILDAEKYVKALRERQKVEPESALNRPSSKRAFSALLKLHEAGAFYPPTKPGKPTVDEKQRNTELWLNRTRVLEEWIIKNADDPDFAKKLDTFVKEITRPDKEEWIKRHWQKHWYQKRSTERKIVEKKWRKFWEKGELEAEEELEEGETQEPTTVEEFEDRVATLKARDEDEARKYYDKWVSKWQ